MPMPPRLIVFALAVLAPLASAQDTGSAIATPHLVPIGPEEHRVELAFAADAAGTYAVRVAQAPAWLVLTPEPAALEAGEGVLAVPFTVAREAVSGDVAEVVLEVKREGEAGVVGRSAFRVELAAPAAFAASAPYPNPAVGRAVRVPYLLPTAAAVTVEAYDVLGRRVLRQEQAREAGAHVAELGVSGLAAGAYVLRLAASYEQGTDVHTARFTVLR